MKMSTPSIPCVLGRLVPVTPATADELRVMRAAVWHKHGIVVLPLDEVSDEWNRVFLAGIAIRLYGARTQSSRQSTPWQEGDVIDRGDGEIWTVVATTCKSITLQRSRDGALATLGQLGEGRL